MQAISTLLVAILVVACAGEGDIGLGAGPRNVGDDDVGYVGSDAGTGDTGTPSGDVGVTDSGGTVNPGDTGGGSGADACPGPGCGVVDDAGPPLPDRDGDGISDADEGNCAVDSDVDFTPDCEDPDSDNDGIPDWIESGDFSILTEPVDTDGDGTPDYLDFDSDDDGIPDNVEGAEDPDDDGRGNYADDDSDGDGIRDAIEGRDDPDGDLIPNYLDLDSDGDTIADWYEAFDDTDGDDIPDRYDLDSDDDGYTDRIEAGDGDLETAPVDTDDDDIPDFQDLDSDGDGLADEFETGCPAASDHLSLDSDDDGYSDLAEVAVGANPCSAGETVFDFVAFFFILPYGGEEQTDELEFSTDIRQADVHINIDTTGSMGGEITNLRRDLQSVIIDGVAALLDDAAFGLSQFRDFPVSPYGGGSDRPFTLVQRVTTTVSAVRTAVGSLGASGGADGQESGWESLYQVATGAGGAGWGSGTIPTGPGIGGVGFREGSLPIVIHITDYRSHNSDLVPYQSPVSSPHYRNVAIPALRGISARVIGVGHNTHDSHLLGELSDMATDTGAIVPAACFDTCSPVGSGPCCTGVDGAGRPAEDGLCPLAFEIESDGDGLSTSVVQAIDALVHNASIEVTIRVIRDEAEFGASGIDTSCFIKRVEATRAETTDSCAGAPQFILDGGVPVGFSGVTPGTQVFFDVVAQNDTCAEPTEMPQVFRAMIEVVGDGVTVLDSLEVTIIVPPEDLSGPK